MELLKVEMGKSKQRTDVLKDMMRRTFPNRWDSYVNRNEPEKGILCKLYINSRFKLQVTCTFGLKLFP